MKEKILSIKGGEFKVWYNSLDKKVASEPGYNGPVDLYQILSFL